MTAMNFDSQIKRMVQEVLEHPDARASFPSLEDGGWFPPARGDSSQMYDEDSIRLY